MHSRHSSVAGSSTTPAEHMSLSRKAIDTFCMHTRPAMKQNANIILAFISSVVWRVCTHGRGNYRLGIAGVGILSCDGL